MLVVLVIIYFLEKPNKFLNIFEINIHFCKPYLKAEAFLFLYSLICVLLLANSLEYPERIQRGLEWTQFLKRLIVLCLFFSCKQIFSFSLFQPSLFIQYSTEECSTVQVFIWCLDTIA